MTPLSDQVLLCSVLQYHHVQICYIAYLFLHFSIPHLGKVSYWVLKNVVLILGSFYFIWAFLSHKSKI